MIDPARYWVTVGDAFAEWVQKDPAWATVRTALAKHPPASVGTCALCGRTNRPVRTADWATWTEIGLLRQDQEE
ncbi:hypothetical protein, partial [Methylacidiphilum caldifontis]|uniref:hypothetical protein n=1 Tax=Methylacidiphilum caldifontis TaxID=2795386 RepID=UPI001ABC29F9